MEAKTMQSDKLDALSSRKLAYEKDPNWESHPDVAFQLLDEFEEQNRSFRRLLVRWSKIGENLQLTDLLYDEDLITDTDQFLVERAHDEQTDTEQSDGESVREGHGEGSLA